MVCLTNAKIYKILLISKFLDYYFLVIIKFLVKMYVFSGFICIFVAKF